MEPTEDGSRHGSCCVSDQRSDVQEAVEESAEAESYHDSTTNVYIPDSNWLCWEHL